MDVCDCEDGLCLMDVLMSEMEVCELVVVYV